MELLWHSQHLARSRTFLGLALVSAPCEIVGKHGIRAGSLCSWGIVLLLFVTERLVRQLPSERGF